MDIGNVASGQQFCCARIATAIKDGILQKPSCYLCVDCGKLAHQYDHRDYNQPLKVEPVCRSCNSARGPAIRKRWDKVEFLLTILRGRTYSYELYPQVIEALNRLK